MATIYRKTAKGHTEIETRALRLPPRLRSALILIDGRRTDDEMRKLIVQQPDEALRTLRDEGFIEIIAITADAPFQRPPGGAVPAQRAAATAPQTSAALSFEALRADAVRGFTDLVGPMAEALAIKMERARNLDELRPLLQTAQSVIGNARGSQAAADYLARVFGLTRG